MIYNWLVVCLIVSVTIETSFAKPCKLNEDCALEEVCVKQVCHKRVLEGVCEDSFHCLENQRCWKGRCRTPQADSECVGLIDCPAEFDCINNMCIMLDREEITPQQNAVMNYAWVIIILMSTALGVLLLCTFWHYIAACVACLYFRPNRQVRTHTTRPHSVHGPDLFQEELAHRHSEVY